MSRDILVVTIGRDIQWMETRDAVKLPTNAGQPRQQRITQTQNVNSAEAEKPQSGVTSLLLPWARESCIHFLKSKFSHSVVSDSLQLHGLQHARLPCPSPTFLQSRSNIFSSMNT